MRWLGIDIGGANLKVADGTGFAVSRYFSLWRQPARLEQELRTLIAQSPPSDHVAATMTGELADCFATKLEGVHFIIDAFNKGTDHRHARLYRLDGKIVTPQVALEDPLRCAATNWHALARFVGRFAATGPALLMDVGSTTIDIVPLDGGLPVHAATEDTSRMLSGELVYTGVGRSPVCAVARSIPFRGTSCPLAHEVFATMHDVYLTLGELPDEPANNVTADGRPATRDYARNRLARSICSDRNEFNDADAQAAAGEIAGQQLALLTKALQQVLGARHQPPQTAIVSGQGEFLARQALSQLGLNCHVVSLADRLGEKVSRCATAHAVAVLADEV